MNAASRSPVPGKDTPNTGADSMLQCPACSVALERDNSQLHCGFCHTSFPQFGSVACLFPEPDHILGRWEARIHKEQQDLHNRAGKARAALTHGTPSATTQLRLTTLAKACDRQIDCLNNLLAPLIDNRGGSDRATYSALNTQSLTDDTTLFSYATNLFRDWVWGDEENQQTVEMLSEVCPQALGKTLVLGAGGGRLAYDLATGSQGVSELWAVDINPFTSFAAAELSAGNRVPLWEFPLAPTTLADVAIERELTAPASQDTAATVHWLLADARALPFGPASFDTVITPWFVDVVQQRPAETAAGINDLLVTGGHWLNFGSVAFAHSDPAECLLLEELCEVVAQQGFTTPTVREQHGPYLSSPHSRFARRELLHAFAARKTTSASYTGTHSAPPAWSDDVNLPVPALECFQDQALATQVHAYLLSLIDGKRCIADIAQVLEQRRLMSAREARPLIQDFLTRMLPR